MLFDGIRLVEGSELQNLTVDSGTSFPSLPNVGELFYRTDAGNVGLYVYTTGLTWLRLVDSTGGLGYTPVNRAGDTMTGTLTLSGDPVGNLDAATKQFVLAFQPAFSAITGKPTTLSGYGITDAQGLNGSLTSIASLATTGLLARSGSNTVVTRSITGSARLSITNGDGVSGNPTIDLVSGVVTTGTYNSLTVDTYGRVTAGTNPTTLSGYGITDAQPLSSSLSSIVGLSGTSGNLVKTGATTWTLDTTAYAPLASPALTGTPTAPTATGGTNTTQLATTAFVTSAVSAATGGAVASANKWTTARNLSLTGDGTATLASVDGSADVSAALTLAASGVTAGTYKSVTVNTKGLVTGGTNPTTLAGFGITDAQPINSNLTAVANLTQNGIIVKTSSTTATIAVVTGTAGNITVTNGDGVAGNPTVNLATTGVSAGTYNSVTVDTFGRVSGGTNPTTLAGYGITDAVNKTGGTMSGNLIMQSGAHITINDAPVSDTDAVNKVYVDALIAGLSWKNAAIAATTGNITLSGTQTIDGVSVAVGNRVLVWQQTTASQNGIYVVASGAWTRSTDANTQAELEGAALLVEQGATYSNYSFVCTNTGALTIGTTAITFVQFNGATGIVAGVGLTKSGNTLSVLLGAGIAELPTSDVGIDLYPTGGLLLTTDGSTSSSSASAQLSLGLSGVAASTYKSVTVDTFGRVTAGTNPTTLAGYGITDALSTSATIDGGSY